MKKNIHINYQKSFYFLLFVFLLSCSTIGPYYDSTASIPRMSFNKRTNMKIITSDDNSFSSSINFGVIAATDIANGKKLNYILVSPLFVTASNTIEDYSLNNSSVLYIKHVQDLISALDEAIKVLSIKTIPDDGIYITYTVTPENLVQKTGEHSIKYYPTFNFRFQRTKNNSIADLWIGENYDVKVNDYVYTMHWNYVFHDDYFSPLSKSITSFKSLLINALNELKKREGK